MRSKFLVFFELLTFDRSVTFKLYCQNNSWTFTFANSEINNTYNSKVWKIVLTGWVHVSVLLSTKEMSVSFIICCSHNLFDFFKTNKFSQNHKKSLLPGCGVSVCLDFFEFVDSYLFMINSGFKFPESKNNELACQVQSKGFFQLQSFNTHLFIFFVHNISCTHSQLDFFSNNLWSWPWVISQNHNFPKLPSPNETLSKFKKNPNFENCFDGNSNVHCNFNFSNHQLFKKLKTNNLFSRFFHHSSFSYFTEIIFGGIVTFASDVFFGNVMIFLEKRLKSRTARRDRQVPHPKQRRPEESIHVTLRCWRISSWEPASCCLIEPLVRVVHRLLCVPPSVLVPFPFMLSICPIWQWILSSWSWFFTMGLPQFRSSFPHTFFSSRSPWHRWFFASSPGVTRGKRIAGRVSTIITSYSCLDGICSTPLECGMGESTLDWLQSGVVSPGHQKGGVLRSRRPQKAHRCFPSSREYVFPRKSVRFRPSRCSSTSGYFMSSVPLGSLFVILFDFVRKQLMCCLDICCPHRSHPSSSRCSSPSWAACHRVNGNTAVGVACETPLVVLQFFVLNVFLVGSSRPPRGSSCSTRRRSSTWAWSFSCWGPECCRCHQSVSCSSLSCVLWFLLPCDLSMWLSLFRPSSLNLSEWNGHKIGRFLRRSPSTDDVAVIFCPRMSNGDLHADVTYSFWGNLRLWCCGWRTFARRWTEFNSYVVEQLHRAYLAGLPLLDRQKVQELKGLVTERSDTDPSVLLLCFSTGQYLVMTAAQEPLCWLRGLTPTGLRRAGRHTVLIVHLGWLLRSPRGRYHRRAGTAAHAFPQSFASLLCEVVQTLGSAAHRGTLTPNAAERYFRDGGASTWRTCQAATSWPKLASARRSAGARAVLPSNNGWAAPCPAASYVARALAITRGPCAAGFCGVRHPVDPQVLESVFLLFSDWVAELQRVGVLHSEWNHFAVLLSPKRLTTLVLLVFHRVGHFFWFPSSIFVFYIITRNNTLFM